MLFKKKPIIKLIFFVNREKKYQEIIKINITKLFIWIVYFFKRSTPKNVQIITKAIPEKKKNTFLIRFMLDECFSNNF